MDKCTNLLHVYYQEGNLGDSIRINELSKWLKKNTNYSSLNIASKPRYLFSFRNLKALQYYISSNSKEMLKNKLFIERTRQAINMEITKNKPQLILAEMDLIGAATLLAATSKTKIAVDVHGIESTQYIENEYIDKKNNKYYQYLKKIEKFVFENCDYLICVTNRMKEYISQNYRVAGKIFVAPNGTSKAKIRAKYYNPLKIIYGGIFAFWEDLDTYLDLAKLDKRNIYYLMGDGPEKERLLARIKKEKINITYLGSKKRDEAHKIFGEMSVGIAPTSKGITRYVASPIKIYDYMSFGLPVITAKCGDWGEEIENFDAGVVCLESNASQFLKAVKSLENKERWQQKSGNAISLAKHSNWDKIFCNNLNLLTCLSKNPYGINNKSKI